MIETFKDRPTETLSGAALAGTVYGLLTQVGVPVIVATIASVVVAFGPAFVSHVVDLVDDVKRKDVKGVETEVSKLVAETVTAQKLAQNQITGAKITGAKISAGRIFPDNSGSVRVEKAEESIPPSQAPTDPDLRGKF